MSDRKRVILVQPKVNENEPHFLPFAVMFLAAAIRDKYDVHIVDTRVDRDWKSKIRKLINEKVPLLVGISCMTGKQIFYGMQVAKVVKKMIPSIQIVWGGVHPSFFPEQTLACELVDYVIVLQGEISFAMTCDALAAGNDEALRMIPGLGYISDSRPIINPPNTSSLNDLADLCLPWDLVNVNAYIDNLTIDKRYPLIDVITSRGCPFRCAFCYVESFYKRKWYARDEQIVIDEIRMLRDRFGVRRFMIHDDLAGFGKRGGKRLLRIFRTVNNGDADRVKFSTNIRVSQLTRPFIDDLVQAGLWQIRAGVESGSDEMLKLMKKDITIKDILNAAKIAKEVGFEINFSFVLGWPHETYAMMIDTIMLCFELKKINPDCTIYPLWNYIPYPGTPFYKEALQLGFIPPTSLEEWSKYYWGNAQMPWVNKPLLENMHTMSMFAFSVSANFYKVLTSLSNSNLKIKIKLRRMLSVFIAMWAVFRMKSIPELLPYEHKLLNPLLQKFNK